MYERGSFARRLASDGSTVFGTWVKLQTLETVELLGHAGFDFVVVDMEHASLTLESAYRAIVVAQAMGMGALVRVPDRSDSHLQRLLDSGADGILVPRVTDAATCRASVDAMRFSPTGVRGMGSTSRAGRWGLDGATDYLEHGRTGIVRGVQVEDQGGLRVIDEILAVEGLSALFIGTGDLSLPSGLAATHPDNDELISKTLAACGSRGVPCGTAVGDATAARVLLPIAVFASSWSPTTPRCSRRRPSICAARSTPPWQAVGESGCSVLLVEQYVELARVVADHRLILSGYLGERESSIATD